jgi:hypothetical protein
VSDLSWTADAWAARLASGNPVYPYEWAVVYENGARFNRVCRGTVRTSADAPLYGILELRITGPSLAIAVAAPPSPVLGIIVRATVVGQLGARAACGIAQWMFGFRDAAGFWGIVLDPAGRPMPVTPPGAARNGKGDL